MLKVRVIKLYGNREINLTLRQTANGKNETFAVCL